MYAIRSYYAGTGDTITLDADGDIETGNTVTNADIKASGHWALTGGTDGDLDLDWSGTLLLFTRRAGQRPEDRRFDFSWFIPAIVKYRKLLGEVLLTSFFLQLFALLTPLFFP